MARHSHPAMAGLAQFGERLKSLRVAAGLSQMTLAARMGFEPAHGYKYILRLEKGLVPNPTLRTIAAFLEACGADWASVVDVLPATTAKSLPTKTNQSSPPEPSEPVVTPSRPVSAPPEPPPVARRDSRPVREQLRQRRIAEYETRTQRYWQHVAKAEAEALAELRNRHVQPGQFRRFVLYLRNCCSIIDAHHGRPDQAGHEIARLQQAATEAGLDSELLDLINRICYRTLGTDS